MSGLFHFISRMDKSHLTVPFLPLELQAFPTVCVSIIWFYLSSQCLFQYACLNIPDTCSLVQYTLHSVYEEESNDTVI